MDRFLKTCGMYGSQRLLPLVTAMRKTYLYLFCFCLLVPLAGLAQTTRVLPWQPTNNNDGKSVYHPEPILFVHGINSNDEGWEHYRLLPVLPWNPGVLPQLDPDFQPYYLPEAASTLINGDNKVGGPYHATQRNYLHTFNYGDYVNLGPNNAQAFDHIEWNAWRSDMQIKTFTNVFVKSSDPHYLQGPPNDSRQCLNDRITEIRNAYIPDPNSTNLPNVDLVAHSMGGLLCHYYLIKSSPDTGVRRLITLATPHMGSMIANWVIWDQNAGILAHLFDGMRSLFVAPVLRMTANQTPGLKSFTAGYYEYGRNGATEDISVNNPTASSKLRHHNELMDFFRVNPAPKIEYVFNVYHLPILSLYRLEPIVTWNAELDSEQEKGDGVVAPPLTYPSLTM